MNQKNYAHYLSFTKTNIFLKSLYRNIPNLILALSESKGHLIFNPKVLKLKTLLIFLFKHLQIRCFVDSTAIDFPEKFNRFSIIIILRKVIASPFYPNSGFLKPLELNQPLLFFIEVSVSELQAVESVSSVFPASIWAEREIWDLYGIYFFGHPDLRRILTDYGFQGHPFRKDFPLSGYIELRYDSSKQRVVYEPVQLTQEYRLFDFISPWAQTQN